MLIKIRSPAELSLFIVESEKILYWFYNQTIDIRRHQTKLDNNTVIDIHFKSKYTQ